MIEACSDCGYAATSVNEVVSLAGVSKKTLYRHFKSKEECFLETYDLVVRDAAGRINAAYRADALEGDWTAGICRAFQAFAGELVERPKASRLALVDVLAVGPGAMERIARAEAAFTWMISRSLAQAPDAVVLPRELVRSLVGGVWFVSRNRLQNERPGEMSSCGEELFEWILSYRSPAVASLPRYASVGPSDSKPEESPANHEESARTRMMHAAARIAVDGGLPGLTAGQIVERAGVEPADFAREFEGPADCFLASLELLSAEALARALRESGDAPDWSTSVCRTIRALFYHLAENRVFARAAFVEAFAAGPAGMARRTEIMRSLASLLARRTPAGQCPSAITVEAIVGAIWSLAHRHVVRDRARALPSLSAHAACLALVPIVGAGPAQKTLLAEFGEPHPRAASVSATRG